MKFEGEIDVQYQAKKRKEPTGYRRDSTSKGPIEKKFVLRIVWGSNTECQQPCQVSNLDAFLLSEREIGPRTGYKKNQIITLDKELSRFRSMVLRYCFELQAGGNLRLICRTF